MKQKTKENKQYDVCIIGAGPAGLTSALYAARYGLKTIIMSKDIGGTANSILILENWPGFSGSGTELMKKFYTQLKKYNVRCLIDEVINIKKSEKEFIITTKEQEIKGKTLIIATGAGRKKLGIKGEKELIGKGVSYCVACDANFFKNKIVAVVGGSDCAATSALALSEIAKKIYIIYRGEKLRCEDINFKKLKNKENIKIFYYSIPLEIKGKDLVESIIFKQKDEKKEIKLDGIFIEIGAIPLTELIKNLRLKLDKEKYIVVDEDMKTNVSGVFAAGDVVKSKLKQVVVSVGQGALAAKSAYDYLNKK